MKSMALVGILILAAVCLCSAQEKGDSAIASKIIALEKAWNQAYKMGDTHALGEILDDSIVLINDDGSVQSKREFLKSVTANNSQEQQVAPESMNVNVFGDTAIATGVFRAKGVEGGKPYVRRERFVDTWIRKGDKWVCVATNATPVSH
jgi:ketosteroid isomerase-like protein